MSKPTPRDVEVLMELFENSDWKELDLRMEGFELYLSKDPTARKSRGSEATHTPSTASGRRPGMERSQTAHSLDVPSAREEAIPTNWTAIRAPNLGTFYRAPKPGAPAYVELGQQVDAETEVCLIEVMKLFTSVRAGISGVVRKIVVQDAEMVEYDQVLLYVEPAG